MKMKTKAQLMSELEAAEKRIAKLEQALQKQSPPNDGEQERDLLAERERLSLALEAAQAGMWEWDLRTNKNTWSDELWPLYGLELHGCEPSYDAWRSTIHPEDRLQAEQAVQTAAQNTTELRAEWRVMEPGGAIRWLMSRGKPILDSTGQAQRFIGVVIDITDRKQFEEKLLESEARYRLIADNAVDVIWVLDPIAGKFIYVSPSVEKLRGYTPEEVMTQPMDAALTPESLKMVSESLTANLPLFIARGSGTESFIDEVDQPCKDNSIVHTEVTTTYLFNGHGNVEIIGVSRNITERKKAEEKLRESEEKYRLLSEELEIRVRERAAEVQDLYDNAPTGYYSLDEDGRFIQINQTGLNWLRYSREEILGRPFIEFVTPAGLESFQKNFTAFKQRGWVRDMEFEFIRKDGSILPTLVNATAIYDKQGQYVMSRPPCSITPNASRPSNPC